MLTLQRPNSPPDVVAGGLREYAATARGLGATLSRSARLDVNGEAALDLGDPRQAEYGLLCLNVAVASHLRRGEDLHALVERTTTLIEAGAGQRARATGLEAGLRVLQAIAMAELLHEAAARAGDEPRSALRDLADTTMARLAAGFAMRFGSFLHEDVRCAFPRFAEAVARTDRRHIAFLDCVRSGHRCARSPGAQFA